MDTQTKLACTIEGLLQTRVQRGFKVEANVSPEQIQRQAWGEEKCVLCVHIPADVLAETIPMNEIEAFRQAKSVEKKMNRISLRVAREYNLEMEDL